MNMLFLNSIAEDIYGGMEEWIRLVSVGLLDRGHNVTIIGRRDSAFIKRLNKMEVKATCLELNISGDFNPVTIFRIKSILKTQKIDIIVVNFNKDIRLGGLAARLAGKVPVVWSVGINLTKKVFIHRFLTPRLIDAVIVPSTSLRNQITDSGYINPDICEIIPIGIPETNSSPPRNDARRLLREKYSLPVNSCIAVTAARFVKQKGHINLVKAAAAIADRFPEIHFLLLGDGPLELILKKEIASRRLSRHFIFAGMLNDVNLELIGADLMIHPSIEEPYGIAVLEGMRAGLPIVASRVGGIPEVVDEGNTALLADPGDPLHLSERVISLLESRTKMNKLGEEGYRRWQKEFRFDIMIDRIENKLADLFNQSIQ